MDGCADVVSGQRVHSGFFFVFHQVGMKTNSLLIFEVSACRVGRKLNPEFHLSKFSIFFSGVEFGNIGNQDIVLSRMGDPSYILLQRHGTFPYCSCDRSNDRVIIHDLL